MNKQVNVIIKKDLMGIISNRRMLYTLLIVPMIMTILLPTLFIFVSLIPEEGDDLQKMLEMLPLAEQEGNEQQNLIHLVLNYVLPVFFLIIPIMSSSVMSAASFVGEKEKRTLETLLYSPLSLKQIFISKVMASFLLSMSVSIASFLAMLIVLEIETCLTTGTFILPDGKWLLIIFLAAPSVSLIAITLIVRVSAKAKSVEDAQQWAIFLLLPVIFLLVGQFTGILLVSTWLLILAGSICALLAIWLLKKSMNSFQYETLLK
ncbi:ABC transporter permease [Lachnospiraceae bacterium 62-35]